MLLSFLYKYSLPLQLILIVIVTSMCGQFIPYEAKSWCYSISLSLKEILLFILPFIIFSYVCACIVKLQKGAFRFIALLLFSVCFSNALATWVAYGIAHLTIPLMHIPVNHPFEQHVFLVSKWIFTLPSFLKNDRALFLGFVMGMIAVGSRSAFLIRTTEQCKNAADFVLNRLFIPCLPLFITGFVLKMEVEGTLHYVLNHYAPVIAVLLLSISLYIGLLYGIASRFQLHRFMFYIKNISPAVIAGFSSMSSAASLPSMVKAAELNTREKELSQAIVPATVNIHMLGDSVGIPIMALMLLVSFGHPVPSIADYSIFVMYYVFTKFAAAAVPGGTIIVMAPVLVAHLGFSAEMAGFITALYILFDPFMTAFNVFGNGAFTLLFTQLFNRKKVLIKKHVSSDQNNTEN